MSFNKIKYNKTRQEFLLTFFNESDKYLEKEINGFWLVKQFNSDKQKYQVAIYGKDDFERYKNYSEQPRKIEKLL